MSNNARVTTKGGDKGTTELFDGTRVSKADKAMEMIGTCDETQAVLAVLKTQVESSYKDTLTRVQQNLYIMMGEFSGAAAVSDKEVISWIAFLEKEQQSLMKKTTITHRFVIPGSSSPEAWCHVARTVARRFERILVAYCVKKPLYRKYIPFINRLSDYLFVLGNLFVQ